MTRPILSLVSDRRVFGEGLLETIRRAALAGVDIIQIREPDLDDRSLIDLVRRAIDAARGTASRILVNDRLDVALAAGAGGVHLRGSSIDAARARTLAPEGFVIGRSVHGLAEAAAAERRGGCDYLTFGTVFPSASKPEGHRAAGLDALRQVCEGVGLPVLAIGGVNEARAPAVAAAGAGGVAAIRLFSAEPDLDRLVRSLRKAFDSSSVARLK